MFQRREQQVQSPEAPRWEHFSMCLRIQQRLVWLQSRVRATFEGCAWDMGLCSECSGSLGKVVISLWRTARGHGLEVGRWLEDCWTVRGLWWPGPGQ